MKFSELPYSRPDIAKLKQSMAELIGQFSAARSADDAFAVMEKINDIRVTFDSQASLGIIRHEQNTDDSFYDAENDFFDENEPLYEEAVNAYFKALCATPYKSELSSRMGQHYFNLAEKKLISFKPEIIEDMQKENSLVSRYVKLRASARIPYKGEDRNLAQMVPFCQVSKRAEREAAVRALNAFNQEKGSEMDSIYDELVRLRTAMAQKLGYDNYVQLGYDRMLRTDYGPDEVAVYRKAIQKHIVPLAEKLYSAQWKRLGIQDPKVWDRGYVFPTGNPMPAGDKTLMTERAREFYDRLSPETSEFFRFMVERELLDLEARKGKAGGGFCDYLPEFEVPFIFSNFNGTSGDIDVLTHEAGHAFQTYSSRHHRFIEYLFATYEACEIHSMSMEFFAWPHMDLLADDADKYRYGHLTDALRFLPYGAMVDEFQHMVYENPEATPEQRCDFYRECESRYWPNIDYGGIENLERGAWWHRQSHIFQSPFYYIDYTLAQICAFQYWKWDRDDHGAAWKSYKDLCGMGGSAPFLELVKRAGIKNPFKEDTIAEVAESVAQWLDGVDDSAF